jgi:hypothetical protein
MTMEFDLGAGAGQCPLVVGSLILQGNPPLVKFPDNRFAQLRANVVNRPSIAGQVNPSPRNASANNDPA